MVRTCTVRIYVPCTKYDTHINIIYIYIYLNPLPFRVSCKKCAAGVKQIDDTISDGGKRIPTYTIKKGVIKHFF